MSTSAFDARLQSLLGDSLTEEETKLTAELAELRGKIEGVQLSLRRVRSIKAVAFPEEKQQPRAKAKGSHKQYVSERMRDTILLNIEQHGKGSVREITQRTSFSEPSVRAALVMLREAQLVRHAGKDGRRGTVYALMSQDTNGG